MTSLHPASLVHSDDAVQTQSAVPNPSSSEIYKAAIQHPASLAAVRVDRLVGRSKTENKVADVVLGEGALWDAHRELLYYCDIVNSRTFTYDPKIGSITSTTDLSQQGVSSIGTVVHDAHGALWVATDKGFGKIDHKGKFQGTCHPEMDIPHNRFNDGKCDPLGRFWAGSMNKDEKGVTGSMWMLHWGGKEATKMFEPCAVSNGIVWTKDGSTMYYIDSPRQEVSAFDCDINTGKVSNRRTVFKVPAKVYGYPDGMTIDSNDNLWIAHWLGSQVTQWDPRTAKLLRSIPMPTSLVTSCAFGGPDLADLYVTTATGNNVNDDVKEKEPLAGSLFVIRNLGVQGVPSVPFGRPANSKL